MSKKLKMRTRTKIIIAAGFLIGLFSCGDTVKSEEVVEEHNYTVMAIEYKEPEMTSLNIKNTAEYKVYFKDDEGNTKELNGYYAYKNYSQKIGQEVTLTTYKVVHGDDTVTYRTE